jgi:hypothetical protein
MASKRYNIIFLIVLIFLVSCKERFEPNLPPRPSGYLVVEGFINAQGPTQIRLSRTTPLDQKQTFKAELNATVKIEGDDNSTVTLSNAPNGIYSGGASINSERNYRLRIKTKDSKEYLSDFVPVKITPPIDSVSWKEEENGVQIYVDTHDPENKTIYYQYDYDETWEIHSAYYAIFKVDRITPTRQIIIREIQPSDPQIFSCWEYDTARRIIVTSSAKLAKDIIHLEPILFIPAKDERLGVRYSIKLRQYAMDKQGYEFMQQMKKNTEALGTLFDPQPSLLKGNIHSVSDPAEIVIGYVNATTAREERIFISSAQLANRGFNIYESCPSLRVPNNNDSLKAVIPTGWPYAAIFEGLTIIAYEVADSRCIDCRERGGSNVKPSFW